MTNSKSPYDELIEKVNSLNNKIVILEKELLLLKRKLEPENPGDINHLYQNWNKN